MYGDFPAKNTVYTPYIPINVWFWPTLDMCVAPQMMVLLVHCTVFGAFNPVKFNLHGACNKTIAPKNQNYFPIHREAAHI